MRFASLSLEHYGPFEAVRLSLDPTPGRLNFLTAPNGAGKSVLRQAFRDLLFGIPGQSPLGFRFGYKGMRLRAELVAEDGASVLLGRRKGNGNTLVDPADNSLDPLILRQLMGAADDTLFSRLFALDSALLRSGAEAMLASGGDLAEALFAAGSGIAGARRLREALEQQRDELAPVRASKARPLYQALETLQQARSDLRDKAIPPQEWAQRSAAIALAGEQRRCLIAEQATGQAEIERLQRLKRCRPWLEQKATAAAESAALADAPSLAENTGERWRRAVQAFELAHHAQARAADALAEVASRHAAEQPDARLLAEERRIEGLHDEAAKIYADHRDLPRRETERQLVAQRLEALLSDLGLTASERLPDATGLAAARDLIQQHGLVMERLRLARDKAAESAGEWERTMAALAAAPEPAETAALGTLVVEARAAGAPAVKLAEATHRHAAEAARLATAVAKLPLWHGGLDALQALVPPAAAAIDRLAQALAGTTAEQADSEREIVRLRHDRAAAEARLAADRGGAPLPDAAAIATARAHRDHGWSLIRRTRFDGEAAPAETEAYSGAAGLPLAFERAIEAADRLADRRNEEGERLAAVSQQQERLAQLDRAIAAAEDQAARAGSACTAAAGAWAALVGGLGVAVATATELREFLAARILVLDRKAVADEAQAALAQEQERQQNLAVRLAPLLAGKSHGSLAEALAAAETLLAAAAAARAERDRRHDRLETAAAGHRQAVTEAAAAEAAVAAWQERWQCCLADLHRPAADVPAAVAKAIELIEEARNERRALQELDRRIAGMRENIAGFAARLGALVALVAPDLAALPEEAAVRALRQRLAAAKEIEARARLLADQERAARAAAEAAIRQRDAAGAEVTALRALIGGASDEETAALIERAAARKLAADKLRLIEEKLLEAGEGWSVAALTAEAAALPADAAELALARLQDEAERIAIEREQAAGEEQRLLSDRQALTAAEPALDAEERRQGATAAIARISSEALILHAAASLLRKGIERLRGGAEDGLGLRIGASFRRITGGTYAGVAIDEDDSGTPFLAAVEADGRTSKRVGELSEGTRDQLFLALRLVMLEDYAAKAPALPFIADDLLQTFDEERSLHALGALADLSRHLQVIVLTHHRHLLNLVDALPPGSAHVCELIG